MVRAFPAAPSAMPQDIADGDLVVYTCMPLEHNGVFSADASPFVHKLLSYLGLARIAFRVRPAAHRGNPSPPKGKFPFARLPTGELVGDSQCIIDELERRRPAGERLDAWLTAEQRALSHVVRRTLEESMYWTSMIDRRWHNRDNFFNITMPMYFEGFIPRWLQSLVGWIIRRSVVQAYTGQGMARHSQAERIAFAREDIAAVEALFPSTGPFFHGSLPSSIDAVLHGFVKGLRLQGVTYKCEETSAEIELERNCPMLLAHAAHMDLLLEGKLREAVGR